MNLIPVTTGARHSTLLVGSDVMFPSVMAAIFSILKFAVSVSRCPLVLFSSLAGWSRVFRGTHPEHRGRHFLSSMAAMVEFNTLETMHKQSKP